jgi:transmembrane sensor
MEETTEIDGLIAASFARLLLPGEMAQLVEWIAEADENRKYYLQLKNIWEVSGPAFAAESIDTNSARRKVLRKISGRTWRHQPFVVWWQRAAAILLLPLLLWTFYQMQDTWNRPHNEVWQEVYAPFGTTSRLILSDGSVVWLNAGSHLKFPSIFRSENRSVVLSGEGYFEVHSDKKHPFVVNTQQGMEVKATGTKFNVEAYPSDSLAAVSLLEGRLSIMLDGNPLKEMKPDQRLTYNFHSKKHQLVDADASLWTSWKDGRLVFRDEPLEDVLKKIGRTYNVEISVKSPAIARLPYRATFEGESLEEILRLLKLTAPLHIQRSGKIRKQDGAFTKEIIHVY